jgi:hypothetical protein
MWRPRLFGELLGVWFARFVALIAIGPTIERVGPDVGLVVWFVVAWILPGVAVVWVVAGEARRAKKDPPKRV